MTKPKIATNADISTHRDRLEKNVINFGYYEGFRRTCQEFDIPPAVCQKLEAMLFKHLLKKIDEGKHEVPKLQASLSRMGSICQAGSVPAHLSGKGPTLQLWADLGSAMQALDGWAISMLETSISLLMVIQNPETGARRVKSLPESFAQLWTERGKLHHPLDNFPGLFDMTYEGTSSP